MDSELNARLQAYAEHLQGTSPVTNYGHVFLQKLWQEFGRETVEKAIAEHPAFKLPCRKTYSIQ